jgi:hypothetical protein
MDMPGSASIELLQRADDQLRRVISRLSPAQAGLPTPCSEFNLLTLINHIVYDVQVFTAMISVTEHPKAATREHVKGGH